MTGWLLAAALAAAWNGHPECRALPYRGRMTVSACVWPDATFTSTVTDRRHKLRGYSWGWIDTGRGCVQWWGSDGETVTVCDRDQPGKVPR